MRKVYRVRTVTNSQHMKGSQRLLKSARQYFCQFFWWLWKRISWNNSVLLVSEILRLFVNMLTPDDMYSLSRKSTFSRNQFKCNYLQMKKYFVEFFVHFRNLYKFCNTLKKEWASEIICFWNYRLQKARLLKWLKSPVSEHLWTVKMLTGPKHCLILQGSIFVKFLDHFDRKSARKILILY